MKGNKVLVGGFLAICAIALLVTMVTRKKSSKKPAGGGGGVVDPRGGGGGGGKEPDAPTGPTLEILFSSSDGKKEWTKEITEEYNAKKVQVGGKTVKVKLLHMRSGESMQAILAGTEQPHLWSPVSRSWFDLINDQWKLRHNKPFVEESKSTVRTALVLATWEPMARALGWPDKPVGWDDMVKVALDPKGWASFGHPEWGKFKFGHSHPDFSTSAMLSLVSMIYAETGKRDGLTVADIKNPKVVSAMKAIQESIVHYGESSSWLTEKLVTRGPSYLSAVPLYESSVVKANLKYPQKAFPLVAIYPKEGTFWENHPVGLVNADWMTDDHKKAAAEYMAFILAKEQQDRTIKHGFRPADPGAKIGDPISRANGADPEASDANALAQVSDDVFKRANALWHETKKKATIYLVLDVSGSMHGEPMNQARKGAALFLSKMAPDDEVQVLAFADGVTPLGKLGKMRDVGEQLTQKVNGLFAEGSTALYDGVITAMNEIAEAKKTRKEPRLYGVVVLSDGKDTASKQSKLDMLELMPNSEDSEAIKVFTIAYGEEADADLLKEVAERSNAVSLKGDDKNIDKIYLSISSYF